jgi:hypothetical protein
MYENKGQNECSAGGVGKVDYRNTGNEIEGIGRLASVNF